MKKILVISALGALSLGLSACGKADEPANTTIIESNTTIEDTDANLSAVDGLGSENSVDLNTTDLNGSELSNVSSNAL